MYTKITSKHSVFLSKWLGRGWVRSGKKAVCGKRRFTVNVGEIGRGDEGEVKWAVSRRKMW